jgi:hypothetical protein
MSWKQPRRAIIPWMDKLAEMLDGVSLPTFRGRSLWIFSDYSFDNRASDFDTVGLLLADPDALGDWNHLRKAIRTELLGDSRSMSWKKLNSDSRRRAALIPFLGAADHIYGLAIALAFHRDAAFQLPAGGARRLHDAFHLSADWKSRTFEKMFRIAYCTALFVAGLSKPEQNIHWVSDCDPAFANEFVESDTARAFAKLLDVFLSHKLGEVRYGTTACGAEPLFQEDLAAIPDLMCGAACEILTSIKREYTDIPEIYFKLPKLGRRSRDFFEWYASGPWPLKRYVCSFESRKGRPLSVKIMDPALASRSPIVTLPASS